jgi:hypothetical protein
LRITTPPAWRGFCLCDHRAMRDRLTAALSTLSDADLGQLRSLSDDAHGQTAGLLAAISHAADWEFHRRGGVDFEMLPLGEAIDEGDLDAALGHAVAFYASIADRFVDPATVRELLVAVVGVLTEQDGHKPH